LNCTVSSTTKASPLELLVGKEARPLGLIPPYDTEMEVDKVNARDRAIENMNNQASYDKIRFDKNKAAIERHKIGDFVLLKNEERIKLNWM